MVNLNTKILHLKWDIQKKFHIKTHNLYTFSLKPEYLKGLAVAQTVTRRHHRLSPGFNSRTVYVVWGVYIFVGSKYFDWDI